MMQKKIKPTVKTPAILFDPDEGFIEISGRSIPENAVEVYHPLVEEWLDEYLSDPSAPVNLNINLEYYNTSSSMWLLRMFKKLEAVHKNHNNVSVNWYYEDEDMLESGNDYQEIISIPFKMIQTEL